MIEERVIKKETITSGKCWLLVRRLNRKHYDASFLWSLAVEHRGTNKRMILSGLTGVLENSMSCKMR